MRGVAWDAQPAAKPGAPVCGHGWLACVCGCSQDKDVFREYYRSFLAKRLLGQKSVSADLEKSAILLLKQVPQRVLLAGLCPHPPNAADL